MDHLEIWKYLTKQQAAVFGLLLGFVIAAVLHYLDSKKSQ